MAYDFGLRLRACRKKKKLSQREVAQRLNISRTMVGAYENNICMPSVDRLIDIAVLYGVSTDYLLNLDVSPEVAKYEDRNLEQQELLDKLSVALSQVTAIVEEFTKTIDM